MARFADVVDLSAHSDRSIEIRVSLLGPLEVTREGRRLDLTGPKRRALLSLLALNLGKPLGRDQIIEALWPTGQTGREDSTLRVHISHIRDVLELQRDGEASVLLTRGSAYMLARERVAVDVEQFQTLRSEARRILDDEPRRALSLLNRALGIWRGRPLQDVEYEDFAQDTIRQLEEARLETVLDRSRVLVSLGEDASAAEDLEVLVRDHPTQERLVMLLMKALYRTGRQPDAIRVARRHLRALRDQGLESSPAFALLEEQILNHDPALLPVGVLAPEAVRPGRSVRGYELREEAGSGAMGIVYRAFQPTVGRQVALKVIHPELAQNPDFVRRFADEAKVIASLEHPHIVPLYDFWREPSGAFLVMRWMDGGNLSVGADGEWSEERLTRVFGQLAEALGYAHAAGVVHRDVKPANVLFDEAGNAYLCDFGLAVAAIDTGRSAHRQLRTLDPPYAAPELVRGEGPTVASDIYGLGAMLGEVVDIGPGGSPAGSAAFIEVFRVATSPNPADRYPDMAAFEAALRDAVTTTSVPMPRRVRRNPYKGLEPFDEGDRSDFYGRDDVVEVLLDAVTSHGLTALIGASGSGKSSVVRAGLIPQLKDGALPGSEGWSVVTMVPGVDPFEEFRIGLRCAAFGSAADASGASPAELREDFAAALDGPQNGGLLLVDQFEELFSTVVDDEVRNRFLENLIDLATDPRHQIKVIVTLRADFSDRPLAHARFGDLMSRSTVLLGPMRLEQVEDAIRRPAARVGIQVEPGLTSEIVRDIASSSAYLPHLQYVLSELFERRSEDRLTVQAYRALGGVEGVLERRAELTFESLGTDARAAARELFLRMIHLGELGDETRRRLPVTELDGLGRPVAVAEAIEAFAATRLVIYDRDPVSRTPTLEVAHETVIRRWTRYRFWIEEARSYIAAHRRLAAQANSWSNSDEDPSYLLTGGPLAAAVELVESGRVGLNELEARFVDESRAASESQRRLEESRRVKEATLRQRAQRRLAMGLGAGAVAIVIAVIAVFAWMQRQRANELAIAQETQNDARELAAASVDNLDSGSQDLSLLLAIEAAELSIDSGDEVLPEVVDALHLALITPRFEVLAEGAGRTLGGNVLDYSDNGQTLAVLSDDGGVLVIDPTDGEELGRVPSTDSPAFGVDFHTDGVRILTTYRNTVREWSWKSGKMETELTTPPDVGITTASYSRDGSEIGVGFSDGIVRVYESASGRLMSELDDHEPPITSLDFDNSGERLVSTSGNNVVVWRIATGEIVSQLSIPFGAVAHVAWNPVASSFFAPDGAFAITTGYGEMWLYQASGERITAFGNGNHQSHAVAFSPEGTFMVAAGADGFARIYGTWTGGEEAFSLPTGGVPLRDAAFNPRKVFDSEVATVGADGKVRVYRDWLQSELPGQALGYLAPSLASTPDGTRYAVVGRTFWYGASEELVPTIEVFEDSPTPILSHTVLKAPWPVTGFPALSPDGRFVSYTGSGANIEIVEIDTDDTTRLVGSSNHDAHQAFSSDGDFFASSGFDGSIQIWDPSSGLPLRILEGHGDRVPSNITDRSTVAFIGGLAFRPGATELASVGNDGTVRIWNPGTGESRVLESFDYEVVSLAYAPDGAGLAVAERTGDVRLLDSETGEEVLSFDSVSGPPDLVFSSDGEYLAGAGPGPFVHLWATRDGRLVRRLRGSTYRPMGVAFVNDDELLVLATEGVLRRYLLAPLDLVALAREKVDRGLTEDECERYLGRSCDR